MTKKKIILLFFTCFLSISPLLAQDIVWAKAAGNGIQTTTNGDRGRAMARDGSGNLYISGGFTGLSTFGSTSLTSTGAQDIFITKYDATGTALWTKGFGGTGIDEGYDLVIDGAAIYLTGSFQGTVDFDPSVATSSLTAVGGTEIFIARYDLDGNYVWAKRIGNSSNDAGYGLAVDASGLYVTGLFSGTVDFDPSAAIANQTSTGTNDIFIAKYDLSGNYLWANGMGGGGVNQGIGLALSGSNVYMTGAFQGSADFDPSAATAVLTSAGSYDMFIAGYNTTTGNYAWAKHIGNSFSDIAYNFAVDATGLYLVGYFQLTVDFDPSAATANLTSAGGNDIFVAKYDFNGNYVWAKSMGSPNNDLSYNIAIDNTHFYITGYFEGTADFDPSAATANLVSTSNSVDMFIARYDLNGNYGWAKNVGGTSTDYGYDLALDNTGVYVTGFFSGTADFDPSAATASQTSAGGTDIFLAKYDLAGSYSWAKQIGNGVTAFSNTDEGRGVVKDSDGNIYIAGIMTGITTIEGTTLTTKGENDIIIAKYNALGVLQWVYNIGGTSNDAAFDLAIDNSGIYVTGRFEATVDFDPSAGTASLSTGGGSDMFIAKYSLNGGYVWAKRITGGSSETGYKIVVDDTHLYVAGNFQGPTDFDPSAATAILTSAGGLDAFVARYDLNGNYSWAINMGGTGNDYSWALAKDAAGVYLTGQFSSSADFDPSAATATLTSAGSMDIFIARYDLNSNYLWAKSMGGASGDIGYGIATDASGIYVTAYFSGTVDFDPSAATANLAGGGSTDIFLGKYDFNGNYLWGKAIGGTGSESVSVMAVDATGIYLAGQFTGTGDFDPSAATTNTTSGSTYDLFVAAYDLNGNYRWVRNSGKEITNKGYGIAVSNGELYVTGIFSGINTNFASSACTPVYVSSTGDADMFVAKYRTQNPDVAVSSPALNASLALGGTTDHILYKLQLDAATAESSLSSASFTTAGTYLAADLVANSFKLRYSADATLDASDVTLATKSVVSSGATLTFDGFSQSLLAGNTAYLFVTADIASSATAGRTIGIATTPLSALGICIATKTGSNPMAAGGLQTITKTVYVDGTMAASGDGLTTGTAKRTFAEAAALVPDTGILSVAGGSYPEAVTITNKSLTINKTGVSPVILQSLAMNGTGKTLTLGGAVHISEKLVLQAGTVASAGHLTLLSDALQTALIDDFSPGHTGTVTGNITAERYTSSATTSYRYLASPVAGATVAQFGSMQYPSYYDETKVTASATSIDAGWVALSATQVITTTSSLNADFPVLGGNPALTPLHGISAYYNSGTQRLSLTGTANTGAFSRMVTRTTSNPYAGYNVLGNPYPSPISWSATWNLNNNNHIHKTVYVWNNSLHKSALYNFATNTSANGGSNEIAQGQAFRIRVNTIGYSMNFNLNNFVRLATSSNNFLRKETVRTSEKLRLALSSEKDREGYETVIHSVDDATAGIDAAYDGEFTGDKGVDVIYSKTESGNLTINALPELKGERTIALGVEVQQAGVYTISATELENFAPATAIYLEDRKLGKLVDLTKESSYTVHLNRLEANRFFVHFNSTAKQEAASTSFVNVYAEDGEVTVQFSDVKSAKGMIAIVNMLGETVAEIRNEQQVAKLRVNQPAGTYLVKIQSEHGLTVKKVILK